MATTATLTGTFTLPNNAAPDSAVLSVTLSAMDTDQNTGHVLPDDGLFTVALVAGEIPAGQTIWQNTAGLRGTHYRATLAWTASDGRLLSRYLGSFQVGDDASYDMADLLDQPPIATLPEGWYSTLTQAQYDAAITARDEAVAAALATGLDRTAAALSAAQAALYDGVRLDSVPALIADTALTYTSGVPGSVATGDYAQVRSGNYTYQVVSSGEAAPDIQTAGGVKLYAKPEASGVPVGAFGAVEPGSDISVAAEKAILAAYRYGGGTVLWPAGNYYVSDLSALSGVRHSGQGWDATILRPSSGSATPMFRAKSTAIVGMADWSHMRLQGSGKANGEVGIDLSAAASWQHGSSIGLVVDGLSRGIHGSKDDRRPFFSMSRFNACGDGYYIINNHPHLHMCDFRDNTRGLTGLVIYDLLVDQCSFVRNEYGIYPDSGGTVRQAQVSASQIFGNLKVGAMADDRVNFSNCLLVAGSGQAVDSVGITVRGGQCSFIGGQIKREGVNGFGDVAILLDGRAGVPAGFFSLQGAMIDMNRVVRSNPSHATYRSIAVRDNNGGVTDYLVDLQATDSVQFADISGNLVSIPNDAVPTGTAFIRISKDVSTVRNMVSRNSVFAGNTSYTAPAISAPRLGTEILDNMIRRTAGIYHFGAGTSRADGNVIDGVTSGAWVNISASITVPSLASGASWYYIILGGGDVGNIVIGSWSATTQGVDVWPSAISGGIRVNFENRTPGTVNLGTGTWRGMVMS